MGLPRLSYSIYKHNLPCAYSTQYLGTQLPARARPTHRLLAEPRRGAQERGRALCAKSTESRGLAPSLAGRAGGVVPRELHGPAWQESFVAGPCSVRGRVGFCRLQSLKIVGGQGRQRRSNDGLDLGLVLAPWRAWRRRDVRWGGCYADLARLGDCVRCGGRWKLTCEVVRVARKTAYRRCWTAWWSMMIHGPWARRPAGAAAHRNGRDLPVQ